MAKQTINVGSSANDGTGDKIRVAFQKCNSNFDELYDAVDPANLISADADNSIVLGTDNKLWSGGGGGSVGTLQQVTDNGNTTTNPLQVIVGDGTTSSVVYQDAILSQFYNLSGEALEYLGSVYDGIIKRFWNGSTFINNKFLFPELPDNVAATIALTSDIPTVDATPTDGSSNAVSSNGVFDALANKVDKNATITGATKTKITYDSKGLVTNGADATTADITDSTDKRYVSDAQLVVIGNTSGINSGDNATNSQYSGLATSKQDTLTETNFGAFMNARTAKNTLVDADEVVSDDSADFNKAKKTTWLNVWLNYLKVKTDALYQSILISGTNIKTINGSSVLGSGNLTVTASIPFDVVFPESYGAVGNGIEDDTTAIQNAINSGFPVWFSAKTYKVTTLTLTSNRILIGEGYNSVLYTTSNAAIINITGDYNNIQQIRFKGNSTGTSQNGIQAIGVVGLTSYRILNVLNNLYGDSLGGSFIYSQYMVGTSSGANHQGSFVGSNLIGVNCNIGIFCDTRGEYNQFYNCSFNGCTKGIHIVAGNITVQGGKMVDNTYGVYLTTGTNDAHGLINGCLINHNTTNVYSENIANGMIFSNCALFAGEIEILTSDGIYFNSCFFGGTVKITSTNSTDLNFNNTRFFTNPTLVITGNNPFFNNCRFATANTFFNSGGDAINYATASTVSGWSGTPTKLIQIVMNGRSAQIFFDINGTATTGSKTMTLPFTNVTISKVVNIYLTSGGIASTNGGAAQINAGASTVTFFNDMALSALPTSGALRVIGMIEIQVAN